MGRLIDGDKLLRSVKLPYIKKIVSEQKTVDAIPVEWIELHVSALEFIGKKESVRRAEAIRNMLGMWRYEQKGN